MKLVMNWVMNTDTYVSMKTVERGIPPSNPISKKEREKNKKMLDKLLRLCYNKNVLRGNKKNKK